MSFPGSNICQDSPFTHVPEIGDMFDFFIEKAYRFHKNRRRDEPIFVIVPNGNNRRGTKFRITCICYIELDTGQFYEDYVDCDVVVRDGVIVHVSVDYGYY